MNIPKQLFIPSPVYPLLQEHSKEPIVFLQVAFVLQGSCMMHSFTSSQDRPSPRNPVLHWQVTDPGKLLQVALWWHGFRSSEQSSISWQKLPSPVKPARQVHLKDPWVFKQEACEWHGFVLHSSMSSHWNPEPEKPVLHSHLYDPSRLVQFAFSSHWFPSKHSFTSWHSNPVPVKPVLHWQPNEPSVFWQVAFPWQGLPKHSSISPHVLPSPV